MKRFILGLLLLIAAACAPLADGSPDPDTAVTSPPEQPMATNKPARNPFVPQPGDDKLVRGNVFLQAASLVIRESFPPQVSLSLAGDLPTPCHQLRVEIPPPDAEKKIMVEAYSVVDPNLICTQVLKSFQEYIGLGTFPAGHYSVWVNGDLAGEFDT